MTKKRPLPEAMKKKQLKKNDPRTKEISMQGGLANARKHAEKKSFGNVVNAWLAYLSNKANQEEKDYLIEAGHDVSPETRKGDHYAIKMLKTALY